MLPTASLTSRAERACAVMRARMNLFERGRVRGLGRREQAAREKEQGLPRSCARFLRAA
jgi:hypothetical protein